MVFGLYLLGYFISRKSSKTIEVLDVFVVTKVEFERDVPLALFGQELPQSHCYRNASSNAELILRRESANQNLAETEPDHVGLDHSSEEADVLIYSLSGKSFASTGVSMLSIYLVLIHLLPELEVQKPDCTEVLFISCDFFCKFVPDGFERCCLSNTEKLTIVLELRTIIIPILSFEVAAICLGWSIREGGVVNVVRDLHLTS